MLNKQQQEEVKKVWLNLSESKRKARIRKAYKILRMVATRQIDLLKKNKWFSNSSIGFLYIVKTYEDAWLKSDAVFGLVKGKYGNYSFYLVRTILEHVFRLEHFLSLDEEKRTTAATKELLRICKYVYDNAKEKNDIQIIEEMKLQYNNFISLSAQVSYPEIANATTKELSGFPKFQELTLKSKIKDSKHWYFIYRILSEQSHGKLSDLFKNEGIFSRSTRSLLNVYPLLLILLDIADVYLDYNTKDYIKQAKTEAETVVYKVSASN